jgi:hypothetical protein
MDCTCSSFDLEFFKYAGDLVGHGNRHSASDHYTPLHFLQNQVGETGAVLNRLA